MKFLAGVNVSPVILSYTGYMKLLTDNYLQSIDAIGIILSSSFQYALPCVFLGKIIKL